MNFFDLTRQNEKMKAELTAKISDLITSGKFILGENVKALESEIASYCGAEYGIGVASGSDALYLSLLACGIEPGDAVITTPFTFYATAGAIVRAGAFPVFVDIKGWNIDQAKIEITDKTKAIIPVHLYGLPADIKCDLPVIEDSAQSMTYHGSRAGCFSFFPTKNLGCFGDGGMVVTNDPEIAERIRMLRVHGAKEKYYHELPGINSRLDEIQAVVLRHKLKYLDGWIRRRREIAGMYNEVLGLPDQDGVYNQYTIQTPDRDKLQARLKEKGIGSAVYYPVPLHLQKVFGYLGYKEGDFPVAEKACREVLSLPVFPELTDEEVYHVAETVKNSGYWRGQVG